MDERVPDDWEPCPPGEFARLATRLRSRRHRRRGIRVTAVVMILVLFAGAWSLRRIYPREYNFAGISCPRVQELARAYADGTLHDPLRRQVREHVARCPLCRPRFRDLGIVVQHVPRGPGAAETRGRLADRTVRSAEAREAEGLGPRSRRVRIHSAESGRTTRCHPGAAVETASASVVLLDLCSHRGERWKATN